MRHALCALRSALCKMTFRFRMPEGGNNKNVDGKRLLYLQELSASGYQ